MRVVSRDPRLDFRRVDTNIHYTEFEVHGRRATTMSQSRRPRRRPRPAARRRADRQLAELYPGDRGVRQPVHTVYIPADTFTRTWPRTGDGGPSAALDRARRRPAEFAAAIGADPAEIEAVYDRVVAKLDREPIEDLRIDFEDGYGPRPDDEEDAAAIAAARALQAGRRRRHGAAVLRDPVQELRAADPAARAADPGPVRRRTGPHRRPAGRLRAHPAEGDVDRPGRGDDGGLRRTRTRTWTFGRAR